MNLLVFMLVCYFTFTFEMGHYSLFSCDFDYILIYTFSQFALLFVFCLTLYTVICFWIAIIFVFNYCLLYANIPLIKRLFKLKTKLNFLTVHEIYIALTLIIRTYNIKYNKMLSHFPFVDSSLLIDFFQQSALQMTSSKNPT